MVLLMMALNGLGLCLLERLLPRPEAGAEVRGRRLRANLALTGVLIAATFALDRAAALAGAPSWTGGFGILSGSTLPPWAQLAVVVVALDGLAYLAHVLMHKLPAAWRFHRVHHSDAHVDVTTAFRQHPLEATWRYAFQLAGVLILGASSTSVAIYLALSALNAQLEHADLSLPWRADRWLRAVFVTPAMHHVHHSRFQAETDTNYSNIFSIWDRLLGTYRAPRPGERIAFGLDGFDAPAQQRMAGLLALPFGS
jgi:sterol desaturase/sphingolipid hydroxylase (fatty acid hydroxylase superfamily)